MQRSMSGEPLRPLQSQPRLKANLGTGRGHSPLDLWEEIVQGAKGGSVGAGDPHMTPGWKAGLRLPRSGLAMMLASKGHQYKMTEAGCEGKSFEWLCWLKLKNIEVN